MYVARAFNAAGDTACAVKLGVIRKEVPQPPPPPPPPPAVPVQQQVDVPHLSAESNALRVLSHHRVVDRRPLPQLQPFPFKPDEHAQQPRKKNRGKVPKPSKFVPGDT